MRVRFCVLPFIHNEVHEWRENNFCLYYCRHGGRAVILCTVELFQGHLEKFDRHTRARAHSHTQTHTVCRCVMSPPEELAVLVVKGGARLCSLKSVGGAADPPAPTPTYPTPTTPLPPKKKIRLISTSCGYCCCGSAQHGGLHAPTPCCCSSSCCSSLPAQVGCAEAGEVAEPPPLPLYTHRSDIGVVGWRTTPEGEEEEGRAVESLCPPPPPPLPCSLSLLFLPHCTKNSG